MQPSDVIQLTHAYRLTFAPAGLELRECLLHVLGWSRAISIMMILLANQPSLLSDTCSASLNM
jgi:hypothetical protein